MIEGEGFDTKAPVKVFFEFRPQAPRAAARRRN
jgi:hypothetical protein